MFGERAYFNSLGDFKLKILSSRIFGALKLAIFRNTVSIKKVGRVCCCDVPSGTTTSHSYGRNIVFFWKSLQFLSGIYTVKMPHRCVVFGCSNTVNWSKGIELHRIPCANDTRPEAKKRGKVWVDFVQWKRAKWEPSIHSEICSKHFKEEDFVNRFVGLHNIFLAKIKLCLLHRDRNKTRLAFVCGHQSMRMKKAACYQTEIAAVL